MTGCAVAATILILMLYVRNERRQRARFKQARADVADMTILFQTMRDVIAQQKTLAHNFNKEMDKKMALVKQVLAASMQKNERLYERQQELEQELRTARERLSALQRQFNVAQQRADTLAEPSPAEEPPAPYAVQRGEEAAADHMEPVSATAGGEAPPENDLAEEPEPPGPTPEQAAAIEQVLLGEWAHIDLTREEDPEEALVDAEDPPAQPEDPEEARQAFRALLNIEPESGAGATTPEESPSDGDDAAGNNGKKDMGMLEQRVGEYDAAGMSVAEIAHELGIGKGEVRLMLSLVKQRKH